MTSTRIVAALLLAVPVAAARAQDDAVAAADAPAAPPAGILPIPDYTGDFASRAALLGDLDGERTRLAEKGIQFGIDWNNTVQSVVTGGRDRTTAYGGTLDYNLTFDLMRMGVLPGAVVKLRGESRYGKSVNTQAGPLVPANTDMFFPATDEVDEAVPIALTTLTFTQYLADTFGVYGGKFDTLDGDGNEFAGGRGLTQFQNMNLLLSPGLLTTVPYSTLGGGVIWQPTPHVMLISSVMATSDSSTTSGFDTLDEGWSWVSQLRVQYRLGRLPGGVSVVGSYAWDNDFATIGRRFVLAPGQGITPGPTSNDSWAIAFSAWQYLFADESAEAADAPLNVDDGRPDRRGFGLFARLGFADEDTNPIEFAASGGLAGRGLIPGRDDDVYGVGYFYNGVQTGRLTETIGMRDGYQGFEAFYNIALTPAAQLTFDVQVLEQPTDRLDTSVVLGARMLFRF